MYGWSRIDEGFRDEVDKFIEAAEKHALTLTHYKDTIICPCKDCKNLMAFADLNTIRSPLIMRGFVPNYTVWTHHGETTVIDDGNFDLGDAAEAERYMHQYTTELEEEMGYDYRNGQGGQYFGNQDGANDAGDVGTEGGAREGDEDDFDNLEDMIRAIGPEILLRNKGVENVERVKKASMETVYSVEKGCPTHWTLLRFVLELLILKAKYGWSDCSFNDLLGLLSWVLPQPNLVPTNTYHAKKVISPLSMGVEKIDACPNHCILFRGDTFKDLDKCPRCGASRYKNNDLYSGGESCTGNKRNKKGAKKVVQESQQLEDTTLGNDAKKRKNPALVLWYLPVTDRLRRIFMNPKEAALMTWWDIERNVDDDVIAHPADASQWQDFDMNNPLFSSDPRNVRFALSTDGMNPFNERNSDHSTWPVILSMYNIPTWLCQKRKYLFLTVLVSGPRQPGFDMDVFLELVM
jgi:hypothetical protein